MRPVLQILIIIKMDSVLELDPVEVKQIKGTIASHQALFLEIAPQLFEDSFHLLMSSQAKLENFSLLK